MDFVRQVPEDNSDKFYILSCEWKEDSFSILVISNDRAWNGKLCTSDAHVETTCDIMGKNVQDYFADLKKGLSTDTDGQFCFLLEHESFLVKKKDMKTGIKVKFCSIPLQEYPTIAAYNSILSIAIKKLEQFANEKKSLQDEVSSLKSDKEDLVKSLELLAEIKTSMENTLYGKFLEVLNAKKANLVADALAAERDLGLDQSFPVQSENSHDIGRSAESSSSNLNHATENALKKQHSDEEDCTSTALEDNHYDSETEVDTEDETALHVEEKTDDENEMFVVPSEPLESSALCVQPSTSSKSSERILPKRGRKLDSSGEEKKLHENPLGSSNPMEKILPKRMKRESEKSASISSIQDYAYSDTVPIPAVNFSTSDSEKEVCEPLQDSTVSAAGPTTKPSDRILPKRMKREGKQTSKDSLPSLAPCTSIDNLEFNSQSLLSEFD